MNDPFIIIIIYTIGPVKIIIYPEVIPKRRDMSEEDIRKKGCFLHVVRYDTSFIRNELAKSLEYIQEYDVDQESREWNRVKEHAQVMIEQIEDRKKFIDRHLTIIKDLTKNHHPELQPYAFVDKNIIYSRDLLARASRKKESNSDNEEVVKLMSDIKNQIWRLDAVLQSLKEQEEEKS
jgi:hypothetical protein